MNKLITKIVGATLGLALAVGVSVGVANSRNATEVNAAYSGASPWTHTFATGDVTAAAQASKVLNNVTWSISSTTYKGWDDTKGIQLGSGSKPQTSDWTMTAPISQFGTNVGITSISVGISTANSGGIAWSLTAGGANGTGSTGSSNSQISSVTTKTATYATPVTSGNVVIALNSNGKSKAIYIHDVSVAFESITSPTVGVSSQSLFFRLDGDSQTVTATGSNFSGAVSYSWAYQSGDDCVDLTNADSATVTMAPKSNLTERSEGVYRVTASHGGSEEATADVTVVADKGGLSCPYTIAEARAAIDNDLGKDDAYVKGVIYRIDSYSTTYHSLTYWISDDGSNAVPFEVYSGKNVGGSDFSGVSDLKLGDIVVVTGDLKKQGSTYEFNYDNELVTRTSIDSISVKTAPTKIDYNSNDLFDPTGLVVTATYDDTPNPTTMDFAYADLENSFSFDPSLTTPLTTENSVTIELFEKEVVLPISLTIREATSVTLMGDMTKKEYYTGDDWDFSGLYLSINWNVGSPATTTVNLSTLTAGTDFTLDKNSPSRGDTTLTISGTHEGIDFSRTITGILVVKKPISDLVRTNSTSLNHSANSYTGVSGITKTGHSDITSEATYAAYYYGATAPNAGAIQLNPSKSTYVCTTASSQYLKKITVTFKNANGKGVKFYGSNTAFTASYDASGQSGTLLRTSTANDSFVVSGNYKYLYIIPTGTTYVESFKIDWKFDSEASVANTVTNSSLTYRYSKTNDTFTYSQTAIRFGGVISTSVWDELDDDLTIQGYGVLFSTVEFLDGDELKDYYDQADGNVVKDFYTAITNSHENPAESNGYYIWNLFKVISEGAIASNNLSILTTGYTAVAYIKTEAGIVFFKETSKSVSDLADDLLTASPELDTTLEGSLSDLAAL